MPSECRRTLHNEFSLLEKHFEYHLLELVCVHEYIFHDAVSEEN